MSSTYNGTSTYPASITIPSDGDGPGIKAADVNAAFEGLADRTTFLSDRRHVIAVGALHRKTGTRTWPSATAYDITKHSGICDSGGSDTPFLSLLAGDIILVTYVLGVVLTSGGNAFNVRVESSESAVDFVTGSWSAVTDAIQAVVNQDAANQKFYLPFAFKYAMAADGHVRFAFGAQDVNITGGSMDDSAGNSCGFYQILRGV
jgi:hypothetical protein